MGSAADRLLATLDEDDPFLSPPDEVAALQVQAIGERLHEHRRLIPMVDLRAASTGTDEIRSLADAVPMLFAHGTYKSYPADMIRAGRWDGMNRWLSSLSTHDVLIGTDGITDVDDWIQRLRSAGHYVCGSSGTTGKASFLNQSSIDRANARRALIRCWLRWSTGIEPAQDRNVFLLAPTNGYTRWWEIKDAYTGSFARPGDVHSLTEAPLRAADINRMGALRLAIGEGTAQPEDLRAFEAEAAERQAQLERDVNRILTLMLRFRDEPIIVHGYWFQHFRIAQAAKALGIPGGTFHPGTQLFMSGGLKGIELPDDYQQQVLDFYGPEPSKTVSAHYGMSELSTFTMPRCQAGRYHRPAWVALLLLDSDGETLLNQDEGEVEGRMALFDLAVEGRWGGLITGDRVSVDFSACQCGRPGPTIGPEIVRYNDLPGGDDKVSCSGTIDAYVSGRLTL